MKILFILLLTIPNAFALDQCFTYKVKDQVISEGQCQKRYPPQSTFKMTISMMGFDSGILKDASHPVLPFKKGYAGGPDACKQKQTPKTWMQNSCVWYSQFVTRELGMEKFKTYLKQFDYGNQDVSGTKNKPDALGTAWITSSLKISPEEQVLFIEKFLDSKLGLKKEVNSYVKDLLFVEDLGDGWKLYGKTGAGDLLNKDGSHNKTLERGWFSGWIENGKEKIIFSQYFETKNIKSKKNNFSYIASKEAKKMAREKMIQIKKRSIF